MELHPAKNPLVRMNGVCPYFTMYPLHFPLEKLERHSRSVRVLDPFCGRGTTNFAARLLGIESFGIDSNPVAAAVANAKLAKSTTAAITQTCGDALAGETAEDRPKGEFWRLCFHSETLDEICRLRSYFKNKKRLSQADIILRAIVLGLLHGPRMKHQPTYLSNQMPRTYATKPASAVAFWKKRKLKPERVDTLQAVTRRAEYLLKDQPRKGQGEVRMADSRVDSAYQGIGVFDLVITSPPYLGMRTYWPDQWLRNWFVGGPDEVEYARSEQITSQDNERFAEDLAKVWRNTASVCSPGARLVIRFGALPSYAVDPTELIRSTLELANAGWVMRTSRNAGLATAGRRQAEQFTTDSSTPIREIDVHCQLRT